MSDGAVEKSEAPAKAAPSPLPWWALTPLANHFPALHGVRVIAILSVIQFHVTAEFAAAKIIPRGAFARTSMTVFFGMDLFFILSGFLIGTMLLHSEKAPPGKGGIGRFYLRRSFRIFPLYYVSLLLLVLVFGMKPEQRESLPYELVYLTNYRSILRDTSVMMWGWSLCVEEHFYLAVPFLMAALRIIRSPKGRIFTLVALWASALGIRLATYAARAEWTYETSQRFLYQPTHTRFDVLVTGIFIAYLQHYYRDDLVKLFERPRVRKAFFYSGLVCMLLLMLPYPPPIYFLSRVFMWGTVTSLMYVPWLLLLLNADGPVQRWLGRPRFLMWATLGYGIYLVHIPFIELVAVPAAPYLIKQFSLTPQFVWIFFVWATFVVSGGVAWILHVLVEKPALALRDRVT